MKMSFLLPFRNRKLRSPKEDSEEIEYIDKMIAEIKKEILSKVSLKREDELEQQLKVLRKRKIKLLKRL